MAAGNKYVLNPFTGQLDAYKNTVNNSNNIVESRICLAGAAIGDLIVESDSVTNLVETVTDNTDIRPVFAVIIDKPTDTTCTILLLGRVSGFSGLTKGSKVFLSVTGGITSTPPTTGYMQSLGVAKEVDTIDFNPNMQRVKRI